MNTRLSFKEWRFSGANLSKHKYAASVHVVNTDNQIYVETCMNVYRSASHESWEADLSMHKVVTKHDSRTISPIALYIIVANYFVSYGNQDHNWCFNIDKYLLKQIIYYRSISVISTVFEIR